MEYEVFVSIIAEAIEKYLPDEWVNAGISVVTNEKVNCKKTGILFNRTDKNYSPTVYMEEYFERFQSGWSMEEVIEDMGRLLVQLDNDEIHSVKPSEIFKEKDKIFFELINTKENEELLKKLPHRSFLDLSIVYRWLISNNERGMASVQIGDDMAKYYGLTEENLYQLAMKNTKELFPIVVKPMAQIVRELSGQKEEDKDEMFVVDQAVTMHVVSNNIRSFGANVMLYPEEIEKLAEALDEDLYLLPSSRQEVVAIPKRVEDLGTLSDMLYEINMTQVPLEEMLSHQIYQLDRGAREVTLATNLPYRPFAKEVEEPQKEEVKERSTRR